MKFKRLTRSSHVIFMLNMEIIKRIRGNNAISHVSKKCSITITFNNKTHLNSYYGTLLFIIMDLNLFYNSQRINFLPFLRPDKMVP